MNSQKNNSYNEHLNKIKYYTSYKINESPKYRPLVNNEDVYDTVPMQVNSTQDGYPMPQSPSLTNEAEPALDTSNNDKSSLPTDSNVPPSPSGDTKSNENPINNTNQESTLGLEQGLSSEENLETDVNELQNDIIKHNINAMKDINSKLEGLNSMVQSLNGKLDALNADVQEVREPTNTEKLMNKKEVSYPYYFNLNDFWSGNWFSENRKVNSEKGIRELPDGTYIADFDDISGLSKTDVQNSFNEYD